ANVYSGESLEHARQAKKFVFSKANSRKARKGGLEGLLDPSLMAKKKQQEKALRDAVDKNPKLQEAVAAWDTIAKVQKIRAKHSDGLTLLCEQLGASDKLGQKVLAGKSPPQRAAELILGTKLADTAVRKELYKGGKEAVAASKDPMILLARLVDERARAVRK